MILITGATGMVGSEVLRQLSAKGIAARAVTRNPGKADAISFSGVEIVYGDFDDPKSMEEACSGVERAFLLTNSTEDAEQQQTAFVHTAERAGVRHIVKLSQLHADPNSSARFLRYHGAVETVIKESDLAYTFLRPNLYMQGLLNFRESIQQRGVFFAAAGDARISAVDVRDVAEIAADSLLNSRHENRTYSLTGQRPLSFAEMAQSLSEAAGRQITCVDMTPERMRSTLVDELAFPIWQADGLVEEFEMYRRGEASEIESGVREALHRSPRPFESFARDYASAFDAVAGTSKPV